MEVYNQNKTQILTDYDLGKGYLKDEVLEIVMPEIKAVEEQGHYETIKEYANGDRDVKWVIDVKGVEYKPAKIETKNILVYMPYTMEELKERDLNKLRAKRESVCFSVVNRGQLWYSKLNSIQINELQEWYKNWLDVTDKYVYGIDINQIVPQKPLWLK